MHIHTHTNAPAANVMSCMLRTPNVGGHAARPGGALGRRLARELGRAALQVALLVRRGRRDEAGLADAAWKHIDENRYE